VKPHKLLTITIALLTCAAAIPAFARPIDFRELSLLVRAHEPESSIVSIASERKIAHPLDASQDAVLRAQGASDSLIRSLHDPKLTLSPAEAAVYENANSPGAMTSPRAAQPPPQRTKFDIIDVSVDQPINLSYWGGPDLELAFRPRDIVETGRAEAELIQPTGSGVHYATYRGVRVPGWEPVDPEYTSIVAHTFARPIRIDWRNPVRVDDVPYVLYPLYFSGRTALYFVGRVSDDVVRLAIVTR